MYYANINGLFDDDPLFRQFEDFLRANMSDEKTLDDALAYLRWSFCGNGASSSASRPHSNTWSSTGSFGEKAIRETRFVLSRIRIREGDLPIHQTSREESPCRPLSTTAAAAPRSFSAPSSLGYSGESPRGRDLGRARARRRASRRSARARDVAELAALARRAEALVRWAREA
jgi:hypothetical protein